MKVIFKATITTGRKLNPQKMGSFTTDGTTASSSTPCSGGHDSFNNRQMQFHSTDIATVEPSSRLSFSSGFSPDSINADEETPLLNGPRNLTGTASRSEGAFMLFKSFVGTGVLFLGKAFFHGGLVFSIMTLVVVAAISIHAFLLLLETKFVVLGSFQDMGGFLYGPRMRYTILASIFISQIGVVSVYTLFVAENLQASVLPSPSDSLPSGLLYVFGVEVSVVGSQGVADIKMFNFKDFPLFIGTAVFSFTGIGPFISITDSLHEPRKFPPVVKLVMTTVTLVLGIAGSLGYLAFGSEVETIILINLDSTKFSIQVVQLFYALAILLSIPFHFLPAVNILEDWIFGSPHDKLGANVLWQKNAVRIGLVGVCTLISWVGKADLGKLVALIGCFTCVPLTYVYPPMLHYRACAKTKKQKLMDALLIVFGIVACLYTTTQTVKLMLEPVRGPQKPGNGFVPPL